MLNSATTPFASSVVERPNRLAQPQAVSTTLDTNGIS